MNVYHLELFYHVVIHEGVSQAAKALGKEQPTVSKQINDLEDYLRVRLFHRRPFTLTDSGSILFQGIERFFRDLPKLEQQVKGGDTLRIGASPIILMYHLPAVEKQVRQEFPKLHLVLREANQPQLVEWLEREEIDLAITLLPPVVPGKVFAKPLRELRMVLLVPKESPLRAAEQLWAQSRIEESLICLTAEELVCRQFQQALKGLEVDWRPQIEVGSLSLVEHYVEEGYGIGLSVAGAEIPLSPKLRILELPGFPTVTLGMMWRDERDRLLRAFRSQIEHHAKEESYPGAQSHFGAALLQKPREAAAASA